MDESQPSTTTLSTTVWKRTVRGERLPVRVHFGLSEPPTAIARRVCDANALGERDYASIVRYLERMHVCMLRSSSAAASPLPSPAARTPPPMATRTVTAAAAAPAPAARTPAPPAVPAQSPSSSSSCGSGSASSSSSSDEEEEEPSDSELSDGQFDEVHFIEQRQGIFSFWQSPQKIKLRFRYADDAAHRAAAFGRKHKFSASQTTDICNFILACQQRAATSTVGGDASGSGVAAAAAHGRDGEAAARSSGDAPEEVVSEVLVLEDVMNENEEGGGAENFFVLPFKGLELRYGLSEDPFVAARKFVKENALAQQDLELISEQLFAWRQQALRG